MNSENNFPIIGIGASAGGLEAFKNIFRSLHEDFDAAYILIQHLDPNSESLLPELIQKFTNLKVYQAENGMEIEKNSIYIIPPGKNIYIEENSIKLLNQNISSGKRNPIYLFFKSLAEEKKEKAIGIILSGTGSEATAGLREIKKHGGIIIVQNPADAQFDSMPIDAIETGLADFICDAEKIPEILSKYLSHFYTSGKEKNNNQENFDKDVLAKILSILQTATGHDFSNYKTNTIIRRINRRMALNQIASSQEYVTFLNENNDEKQKLFADFLIGVTEFFRDDKAFEKLQKVVLSDLIIKKSNEENIRVWIPACSTGEEAYSIAILINEEMQKQNTYVRLLIFATDVDEISIEKARKGLYKKEALAKVSPDILKKYFTLIKDRYQIKESIRESIVFSVQSIIKDPPFSKMDLISCRNLLIYLDKNMQETIMPLFHYSLNPGKYLFLGSSESLGIYDNLFESIDNHFKIFKKTDVPSPIINTSYFSATKQNLKSKKDDYLDIPEKINLKEYSEKVLLKNYCPTLFIVNEKGHIVYVHGKSGKYIENTTGIPTYNLLKIARDGLKTPLISAFKTILSKKEAIILEKLEVKTNGKHETVNVILEPILKKGFENLTRIILFEHPFHVELEMKKLDPPKDFKENEYIMKLEEELQLTIEELDLKNEEIKTTSEELQSANEELQSSNEELSTSKEELQSINEELQTLNTELKTKNSEMIKVNDDIKNLLESTQIATVFLDLDLNITNFTPKTRDFFKLIKTDIGRPITDITHDLYYHNFVDDSRQVINTQNIIEKEIKSKDGNSFWNMKIIPYLTSRNEIRGVVVTFSDITKIKTTEQLIRESEEKYKDLYNNAPVMFVSIDHKTGKVVECNETFLEKTGYTLDEVVGHDIFDKYHSLKKARQTFAKFMKTGFVKNIELQLKKKDGGILDVSLNVSAIKDSSGNIISSRSVLQDITEKKKTESELAKSEMKFRALFEQAGGHFMILDPNTRDGIPIIIDANEAACKAYGYTLDELIGQPVTNIEKKEGNCLIKEQTEEIMTCVPFYGEATHMRKNGSLFSVAVNAKRIDIRDEPPLIFITEYDISQRKKAQEELLNAKKSAERANSIKSIFLANMSHELRTPLNAIVGLTKILCKTSLNSDQKVCLTRVIDATGRMGLLVKDILDLQQLETGTVSLRREEFNLNSSLDFISSTISSELSSKPIEFSLDKEKNIPDLIVSDQLRVEQVLLNVLENSVKYTENGFISLSVSRKGSVDEKVILEFIVKDSGIGIEKNKINSIFKRFEQGDMSFSKKYQGVGLGLSIVKELVALLDGDIDIESTVGKGTTFKIALPFIICHKAKENQSALTEQKHKQYTCEKNRLKILIAEDNTDNMFIFKHTITNIYPNAEIIEAKNGLAAVEEYKKEQPDIIFMDIQMPEMDGIESTVEIRKLEESSKTHLPIIGITAYSDDQELKCCVQKGMDKCFSKPINEKDLKSIIDQLSKAAQ